jgi:arylsulfatase I/J
MFKYVKLLWCILLAVTLSVAQQSKPNLVFMLVDDWGWANVGYHRDPPTNEVVTPNIDGLVKEGLELDQHYAYQYCSPSRSSLLSGRLPIHVNDANIAPDAYNPQDPISGFAGIPRNMTGLGTKMKLAGYAAHQVGKWDAGMATPDHIPTGRGFDSSFGYYHHDNDYYTETIGDCNGIKIVDLWDTSKPAHGVNGTGPDNYEEGLFKLRVLDVINNHNTSSPLFLYYAPHIVHTPLQVPASYYDKFNFIDDVDRHYYHAMVNYLDDIVGELVDALKKKGMWENTLFVTSSDNGGPEYPGGGANNYPLKGGKLSDWQGGIRVNAFVSGGYLPEKMRGQKTTGYIHLADWYATFCAIAGVDPTDERAAKANLPPIDSMNMWPLISGETMDSPRKDVPASHKTLISGDYKILTGILIQASWTGPQYPNKTRPSGGIYAFQDCGSKGCLYNIKQDPEERVNLAKSQPAILKDMQQKLATYQATYFNPNRGKAWPGACTTAMNTYRGFWGPFLP